MHPERHPDDHSGGHPARQPDRLLRTTLAVNALSSGAMGAAMAVAATPLSDLFGIPSPILLAVGIGLVPFAMGVWRLRRRPDLWPSKVRTAIVADMAWVVASIAALAVGSGLTTLGAWVVGLVAMTVATYALFQWLGLRRLASAPTSPPAAAHAQSV